MSLSQEVDKPKVEKKRVLLVVRWPVGGIRTFIRYVYRNFAPSDWHFTILAPDLPEMRVLVEDLAGFDFQYRAVEEKPSPFSFSLRVASELLRESYDLVHSHGFTSGMCAAIPAFLRRTPHLMTSHDVINAKQLAGTSGRVKRLCMAAFFALIDKIQSVSHDAQENLFESFPGLARTEGKCVVIPNGIEIERFFEAEPRDLRGELDLDDEVFLIGFLGRFMAQKGFRYLIDAVEILQNNKDLPKRPLVLTFGDGGFIREEKQTIKEKGLEDSFRFMPFTANVAGTIKGVDVVTMPSLWEACGLLAMETLVCGTPLVGSDCIGLREVLQGTPAIVVRAKDGNMLAEAIEKEIKNPTKIMFISFVDEAASRFEVRKQSLDLLSLYEKIIPVSFKL